MGTAPVGAFVEDFLRLTGTTFGASERVGRLIDDSHDLSR